MVPLDEAYFVWLYSQVGSTTVRNLSKTYWNLLRILYRKEFAWFKIERDKNRAEDGKELRREFLQESKKYLVDADDSWLAMDCSMLEMLIALSRRLAFNSEGEPSEWLWVLIDNLGLLDCTDANLAPEGAGAQTVILILDRIIDRDYAMNGDGGLFPLKSASEDQRGVEVWYQANAYLLERFYN